MRTFNGELPIKAYEAVDRKAELARKEKMLEELMENPNSDSEEIRILSREIDLLKEQIAKDKNLS